MRELPRPFVTFVLVASLLLPTITVAAQGQMSDWSRVTALPSGSKLSVKLKNGKSVKGTLRSVSDNAMSLTVKNAPVEVKRDDVRTVHAETKKGVAKATLIGMAVGAGGGAILGAIGDTADENNFFDTDGLLTAGLAIVGAGVGALAGFLVGKSGSKRVLIYEAK